MRLQVALDFIKLDDALNIAKKVCNTGAHILEAGTPLIKSEGMKAVRALKDFSLPVMADLKTMDTGYLEAELAAVNGADIVSVMAAAADETIKSAMEAAEDYGIEIMVDMMNNINREQVDRMVSLAPDYMLFHIGIDQQMGGVSLHEKIAGYRDNVNIKIALAGGLNAEKIRSLPVSADIIIVGGAITKAKDPFLATKEILEAMQSAGL